MKGNRKPDTNSGWRWTLRFITTDQRPADYRCFGCGSLFKDHACNAPGPYTGWMRNGKHCPECGSIWGPEHRCHAAAVVGPPAAEGLLF